MSVYLAITAYSRFPDYDLHTYDYAFNFPNQYVMAVIRGIEPQPPDRQSGILNRYTIPPYKTELTNTS